MSEYDLFFPLHFLTRPGPQHIPLGTNVSREPLGFPGRLCLGRSLPTAGIFLTPPESLRGGEARKSFSLESSLWGPARVPRLHRHHLKGMWGPDKRLPLSHFLFARTSRAGVRWPTHPSPRSQGQPEALGMATRRDQSEDGVVCCQDTPYFSHPARKIPSWGYSAGQGWNFSTRTFSGSYRGGDWRGTGAWPGLESLALPAQRTLWS